MRYLYWRPLVDGGLKGNEEYISELMQVIPRLENDLIMRFSHSGNK